MTPDDARQLLRMEAGEAALGRGDAPAALAHYQAAVVSAPDQYLLRVLLAKAHTLAGDLDRAVEQLFVAIELAPEEAAVHEEMYLVCERMAAFPEAYREAEWLTSHFPDNLRYLYWAGVSLLRVGKPVEAKPILEQVVSLSSRSADARQALAAVYFRLEDLPRAQVLLEEARRMDPSSAAVAIDLGSVYRAQDKTAEAEQVLSAALRQHSEHAGLHLHLALTLASRDKAAALEHAAIAAHSGDIVIRTEAERLMTTLA